VGYTSWETRQWQAVVSQQSFAPIANTNYVRIGFHLCFPKRILIFYIVYFGTFCTHNRCIFGYTFGYTFGRHLVTHLAHIWLHIWHTFGYTFGTHVVTHLAPVGYTSWETRQWQAVVSQQSFAPIANTNYVRIGFHLCFPKRILILYIVYFGTFCTHSRCIFGYTFGYTFGRHLVTHLAHNWLHI
jgi:hypothetical protein